MIKMNILLIDKRVFRYEDIVAAIDPALAVGVVFDYFEDTFDTLKVRIIADASALSNANTTGISVGLLQHNYRTPMFSMLASADVAPVSSVAARDPDLARWSQFRDFITWCKTAPEIGATHFDMMACALYSNKDWKYVIDTLTAQTGVTVRASTDDTGAAALGGDWFLESHTGVNLKTVYFTELIEEYRGVLYLPPSSIREYSTKGFATGSVEAWGYNVTGGTTPDNVNSGVVAVYSVGDTFVALKTDGTVVAWGSGDAAIAPTGVTDNDSGVIAVYSNYNAFAALKANGRLVVWGLSEYGGDDPGINGGVVAVYSNAYAFAALKNDGSVVAWGNPYYGGITPENVDSGVVAVYSAGYAFTALKNDGTVVVWGDSSYGAAAPIGGVTDVIAVYSTEGAFAALKNDGRVIAWGFSSGGGLAPNSVTDEGSDVVAIYSTNYAFAALKRNGTIVAWGDIDYGGAVPGIISGVVAVYSTDYAFAALKSDGSVVAWGNSYYGGTNPSIYGGVVAVYSTSAAFAALKSDGTVVAWGDSNYGGLIPENVNVTGVVAVYSTMNSAFAALKADGSVVSWGVFGYGGINPEDISGVTENMSGGVVVTATSHSFAALKTTATSFNLSGSYYTDMDRYDILRKKENRRRVNLTTLNNNVFTLSQARDIQNFNPTISAGRTFRIIVPDYTASSYSITSTATIPSTPGNYIIACDEGERVTVSGTTYVNYGTYVYRVEIDNTYTKLTTATIGGTSFTLYGGDGINSSGILLDSGATTQPLHWVTGIDQPYVLATHGSYMYVGRRDTGHGIDRRNLSDGSLDTENWINGSASNMFNIASMVVDSSNPASPYLYVAASTTSETAPADPTNIFKISLADASIVSSDWAPDVTLVGNIAVHGGFLYAVHYSDGVIRKLDLANGSLTNSNFATVSVIGDTQNVIMQIDDIGRFMYVQRGLGRISRILMSNGEVINADWINVSPDTLTDGFILYGPSIYATNVSNGNIVDIHLVSRTITNTAWATSTEWDTAETSRIAMTIFGSSLYAARTDTGTIEKLALPAVSNICFPANAPVQTDQGVVAIALLSPAFHTIQGMRVIDVTKTVTNDSFLIRIGRDALGKDYPAQDTVISRLHKLEYKGRMVEAEWFVGMVAGVERIPYSGEPLYNVILSEPRTMRVNNLVCETLLPSNPIAKLYGVNSVYNEYARDTTLTLLKTYTENNDREGFRKLLSSL
jgi:hypothetical protein